MFCWDHWKKKFLKMFLSLAFLWSPSMILSKKTFTRDPREMGKLTPILGHFLATYRPGNRLVEFPMQFCRFLENLARASPDPGYCLVQSAKAEFMISISSWWNSSKSKLFLPFPLIFWDIFVGTFLPSPSARFLGHIFWDKILGRFLTSPSA